METNEGGFVAEVRLDAGALDLGLVEFEGRVAEACWEAAREAKQWRKAHEAREAGDAAQ